MSNDDFFEIDFLDVQSSDSGDAVPLRIYEAGVTTIHAVDGGFQDTGDHVVSHIKKHYNGSDHITRVVATHPDGDHTGGLRSVLGDFEVGELWMLRPWLYVDQLLPRFKDFSNAENLKKRLKEIYSNIAALEEIAQDKEIPIREPFQGAAIGRFTVLAPTRERYLDLVVHSERTPTAAEEPKDVMATGIGGFFHKAASAAANLLKVAWGEEAFSSEETSAENDMSVVQYAEIYGKRVLLTGDAGRTALHEAADHAIATGIPLPGIDRFQVPHHGSRRNVSTGVLDRWLGEKLPDKPAQGEETFTAIISAAREDEDHPRKAVVRACIHRGARVISTEGNDICTAYNAPTREGWSPCAPLSYPEYQEE